MGSIQFLPTHIIPSLEEIVSGHRLALLPGPYSRQSFIDFLKQSHCAENLEFVLEVDTYVSKFDKLENVPFLDDEAILENLRLVKLWSCIYDTYVSRTAPKEVNVPGKLLDHFLADTLPEPKELLVLRKQVYELLSANYNDFVTTTRETHSDRRPISRRCLEMVAPETVVQELPFAGDFLLPDMIFHTISPDLLAQWEKTLEIYELLKLASSCESSGTQSRTNSAGAISTRPLSRGLSLGSVFDNIREYSGWKKTVRKLRTRRASSEKPQENFSL